MWSLNEDDFPHWMKKFFLPISFDLIASHNTQKLPHKQKLKTPQFRPTQLDEFILWRKIDNKREEKFFLWQKKSVEKFEWKFNFMDGKVFAALMSCESKSIIDFFFFASLVLLFPIAINSHQSSLFGDTQRNLSPTHRRSIKFQLRFKLFFL